MRFFITFDVYLQSAFSLSFMKTTIIAIPRENASFLLTQKLEESLLELFKLVIQVSYCAHSDLSSRQFIGKQNKPNSNFTNHLLRIWQIFAFNSTELIFLADSYARAKKMEIFIINKFKWNKLTFWINWYKLDVNKLIEAILIAHKQNTSSFHYMHIGCNSSIYSKKKNSLEFYYLVDLWLFSCSFG